MEGGADSPDLARHRAATEAIIAPPAGRLRMHPPQESGQSQAAGRWGLAGHLL